MNEFHMTVGTTPDSLNVEKDISFIKVGLLYGDKVKLESIGASVMLDVLNMYLIQDDKTKAKLLQTFMGAMGQEELSQAMFILYKKRKFNTK